MILQLKGSPCTNVRAEVLTSNSNSGLIPIPNPIPIPTQQGVDQYLVSQAIHVGTKGDSINISSEPVEDMRALQIASKDGAHSLR